MQDKHKKPKPILAVGLLAFFFAFSLVVLLTGFVSIKMVIVGVVLVVVAFCLGAVIRCW